MENTELVAVGKEWITLVGELIEGMAFRADVAVLWQTDKRGKFMGALGSPASHIAVDVDVKAQKESRNQIIAVQVRTLIKEQLKEDDCPAHQQDVLSRLCKIISGEQLSEVSLVVLVNDPIISQSESTVLVELKPVTRDWGWFGRFGLSQEGRSLLDSNRMGLSQDLADNSELFLALVNACEQKEVLAPEIIAEIRGYSCIHKKITAFLNVIPTPFANNAGMVIEFLQREKMLPPLSVRKAEV